MTEEEDLLARELFEPAWLILAMLSSEIGSVTLKTAGGWIKMVIVGDLLKSKVAPGMCFHACKI